MKSGFRISDLDVCRSLCRIASKMLWIYHLVGVSHFAECRENRGETVWEMLINLLKSPIPQFGGKRESDLESVSRIGSPPNVNQFFRLVGPIISFNEIGWLLCSNFAADRQNEWQTNRTDSIITYKLIVFWININLVFVKITPQH